MQELTSLNLRFFLALNHDLYKGKVVGSLQLAKNKNKFMGRVKSLDVRCNDALLMVRHFLANQLTYFYVYYIYIYQSQLSVSSANAVLQTKKQNWKVFWGADH